MQPVVEVPQIQGSGFPNQVKGNCDKCDRGDIY